VQAFHSGVLKAVQSTLGRWVRPGDIKYRAVAADGSSDYIYYARFREAAGPAAGWTVQRSLPQLERVKRMRKSVTPLSPDPLARDYSRASRGSGGGRRSSGGSDGGRSGRTSPGIIGSPRDRPA
jgi:hypothetical protein